MRMMPLPGRVGGVRAWGAAPPAAPPACQCTCRPLHPQAGKCSGNGEALEDWREVLPTEQAVVYNKQNLLNPFFVAFGTRRAGEAAAEEAS
jgi:hypothetical protein